MSGTIMPHDAALPDSGSDSGSHSGSGLGPAAGLVPDAAGTPPVPTTDDGRRSIPLPAPCGPVTGALVALLAGPPDGQGAAGAAMPGGRDVRAPGPWWEADRDTALALVHLDELARHGLQGVHDGWRGHPLLVETAWTLGAPVRRGLVLLAGPAPVTGCATTRAILGLVAAHAGRPPGVDGQADPGLLREEVLATAVQAIREREAVAALLPGTPEPPAPESVAEVLELVGLGPVPSGGHAALPTAALWRLAAVGHLSSSPVLLAPLLGWLAAAAAIVAAGRVPVGERLRAHGLDRTAARAWDAFLGMHEDWRMLDVVEQAVDRDASAGAGVMAGARAAVRAADEVELALAARSHGAPATASGTAPAAATGPTDSPTDSTTHPTGVDRRGPTTGTRTP